LETSPSLRLEPEERSRGVRSRRLAGWRPEGKRWVSPRKVHKAVAVMRPIPGRVRRRSTMGYLLGEGIELTF
jgi:hypothetical protein